jgi:hypothetical protein
MTSKQEGESANGSQAGTSQINAHNGLHEMGLLKTAHAYTTPTMCSALSLLDTQNHTKKTTLCSCTPRQTIGLAQWQWFAVKKLR